MNNTELNKQAEEGSDIAQSVLDLEGTKAGYKIEIFFGAGRSAMNEFYALISVMESGKFFHGGGDSVAYFCLDCRAIHKDTATKLVTAILDKKEPSDKWGCAHPIVGAAMGGGIAHCPNCQRMINSDNLTGQLPFHGTTQDLAKFVARYFEVLQQNADIYCKYDRSDIRYLTMEKAQGLDKARSLRGLFIYPLNRILKDISAGATLESRFRAFFNA